MRQTTLSKSVSTNGIGLHTGVPVSVTLRPAPENTGYIFVRTDLDDFEIPRFGRVHLALLICNDARPEGCCAVDLRASFVRFAWFRCR